MTACLDDSQGPYHQIDVDVIPSIIFDLDLPVAAVIRGKLGALVVGHASQGIPEGTDQVALLLAHDKLSGKHPDACPVIEFPRDPARPGGRQRIVEFRGEVDRGKRDVDGGCDAGVSILSCE